MIYDPYYDELTPSYIATLKEGEMGPPGRSIALATSSDFEHWNGPERSTSTSMRAAMPGR